MSHEEILLHIQKIVDHYQKEWEEATHGNAVLEMRYEWMWAECAQEIKEILKEID